MARYVFIHTHTHVYVYTYAGELFSVPLLGGDRPESQRLYPPLGGPFSHHKNRVFEDFCVKCWSQLAFWGFQFLLNWAPFWGSYSLGNGWNTVSRVLFRRRELTEFYGKLGEFCEELGEFALAHKKQAERNSLSSLPGTR